MKTTRIAILHDYFGLRGGGERLLMNLARAIDADIYTGFVDSKNTFDTNGMRITEIGRKISNPFIRAVYLMEKFKRLDLRGKYDFFIFSGTLCISAAHNKPNLLYLHTPPRHMYDLREWFGKNAGFIGRMGLRLLHWYLYPRDQKYMRQFDVICPNSENVALRVKRFYGEELYRKCRVVYTGIETGKFYHKNEEGFYLSASRLDPLKRIDVVIEAFRKMPEKTLIVIGTGPDEKKLRKQAEGLRNIRFLGPIGDAQLLELYARCNGVISANVDEDLGLSAIECQAAGKPAIVVREGGFKETVIDGKTGVFFEPNADSLRNAVQRSEGLEWDHKQIQQNAKQYGIETFASRIKGIIEMELRR